MKRVKFVLTERWYTWENARNEAMSDEEINMYADLDAGETAYLPKDQVSAPVVNSICKSANVEQTESSAYPDAFDVQSQSSIPPPAESSRPEARA